MEVHYASVNHVSRYPTPESLPYVSDFLNMVLMNMRKYLIFLACFHLLTASPFKTLCSSLNTPSSRQSFYHHGRCYVITAQATNITWATAATTCTDMPATVHGGLALWLPLSVFDWLYGTVFNPKKWVFVGVHANTTMGNGDSTGKSESNGLRFGQGPTVNDAR